MFVIRSNTTEHYLQWHEEYSENPFGMKVIKPSIGWAGDINAASIFYAEEQVSGLVCAFPPGSARVVSVTMAEIKP